MMAAMPPPALSYPASITTGCGSAWTDSGPMRSCHANESAAPPGATAGADRSTPAAAVAAGGSSGVNSPILHWGVAWGDQYHLGTGTTLSAARDDALARLAQSTHAQATELLAQLEECVPMIFWNDYPPPRCLGYVPLPPGRYRRVCDGEVFPEPIKPRAES
jgi:hypothetical protein